jgi:hypothetical protein
MNEFINDNGDTIIIAEMDKWRLVHSIAKYARAGNKYGRDSVVNQPSNDD